jgi:hypothetical protein
MIPRCTLFFKWSFTPTFHYQFTTNSLHSTLYSIPHNQPLYSLCLSFSMPSLCRLSLNLASLSIAQLSRLLRLSIYMPNPRASQFRSEAPSLHKYEFNAPEAGLIKPRKLPTVDRQPNQPNVHTVPPSTYVPIPILPAIIAFGISRSLKVAIIIIDNQVIPLLSTKQGRLVGLDPKSLLESIKVLNHLQFHKESRINIKQQTKNLPLILIGSGGLCSNIANRI